MKMKMATGRRHLARFVTVVSLTAMAAAQPLRATTYVSAEPIPSQDVVGADALARILSAGYPNLEQWSQRLLDCGIVDNVIAALDTHGAISTIHAGNTSFSVAAGGFESVTNPSYVFTVRDSGPDAASTADVDVLDNALGYVLNQGGTAHFSPDNAKAYAFALDYAVVTFDGTLTGVGAKAFFDYLGTIDSALWSGQFAGFTQIAFQGSASNNSMLFLQPAASKNRFVSGLFTAATTTPGATYMPIKNSGQPTTARASVAFPGNDWISFPDGDQYLSRVTNASPELLAELAALRLQHLRAVEALVKAIAEGRIRSYLAGRFSCPAA